MPGWLDKKVPHRISGRKKKKRGKRSRDEEDAT